MFISEKGGEEQERVLSPLTAGAYPEKAAAGSDGPSLVSTASLCDRRASGGGAAAPSRSSPALSCDGHVIDGEVCLSEAEDGGVEAVGVRAAVLSSSSSALSCD